MTEECDTERYMKGIVITPLGLWEDSMGKALKRMYISFVEC